MQRRDAGVLARDLPPKAENVLYVRLSPLQQKLYTAYMHRLQGAEPGQLAGAPGRVARRCLEKQVGEAARELGQPHRTGRHSEARKREKK